jgi:hypothetical protein
LVEELVTILRLTSRSVETENLADDIRVLEDYPFEIVATITDGLRYITTEGLIFIIKGDVIYSYIL